MQFKDYFSKQSRVYAKARPTYPEELFSYLSGLCAAHDLAWDCATGNGQAAVSLKNHFSRVIATDASEEQIKNAQQKEGVQYYTASAYDSGLTDHSADIVTVATAAHWFHLPEFYKEAGRVLKPEGILAIWGYTNCSISETIDPLMRRMIYTILKDHWPPEYQVVDNKYRDITLPYPLLNVPSFTAVMQWDMGQLMDYMMSWSGTQRYMLSKEENPLDIILPELRKAWGDEAAKKNVSWELYMKVCRKA